MQPFYKFFENSKYELQVGDEVVCLKPNTFFHGYGKIVSGPSRRGTYVVQAAQNNIALHIHRSSLNGKTAQKGDIVSWEGSWHIVNAISKTDENPGYHIFELLPLEDFDVPIKDLKLSPEAQNKKNIQDKYGSELEDI